MTLSRVFIETLRRPVRAGEFSRRTQRNRCKRSLSSRERISCTRATQFASRFISITVTAIVLRKSPAKQPVYQDVHSDKETDCMVNLINYRPRMYVTHVCIVFTRCVHSLSDVHIICGLSTTTISPLHQYGVLKRPIDAKKFCFNL